jgi:hypothetical protein
MPDDSTDARLTAASEAFDAAVRDVEAALHALSHAVAARIVSVTCTRAPTAVDLGRLRYCLAFLEAPDA